MRIIFIVLITNVCFGQLKLSNVELFAPRKTDSLIVGDWFLKETIITARNINDSIPIIQNEASWDHRITFTSDSLIIHPYNSPRFYRASDGYRYSLLDRDLELFIGVKKKKRVFGQYFVVQCTFNELILGSFETIDNLLINQFITVFYIYHKNEDYQFVMNKLYGKWTNCSDVEPIVFLNRNSSNKTFFYKDTLCEDQPHSFTLEFSRNEFKMCNEFSYESHDYFATKGIGSIQGVTDGIMSIYPTQFYIDISQNLIYFSGTETMVYKYEFIDPDKISFELHKVITVEKQ